MRRRTDKNQDLKDRMHQRFEEIWRTRPHRSEISNEPLDFEFGPAMFFVFSHVCSRGQLPRESFQLMRLNICLMTYEEHQLWEFQAHKIKHLPEWQWLFQLKEYIHQLYYMPEYKILRYFN